MKYGVLAFRILLISVLCFGFASAQPEVRDQAVKGFQQADTELNQVYQQLTETLKDERAVRELVQAQRAWLAFRDAEARFRAGVSSEGGSAYAADHYGNLEEMTRQRAASLKALLARVR